jgi:hypothetical protein
MSSPKEARKFHEAERHNVVLSHEDFSFEQNFDYLQENESLVDFLLSKNWDKYFTEQKSGNVICDTGIANKIFDSTYQAFHHKMDTVQMFHIITDFYTLNPTYFFNKLVQTYRKKLARDLEIRIGKLKSITTKKVGNDRLQVAFNLILGNSND